MPDSKFEYGPISRGVYIALISATTLVPFFFMELLGHYLLLLVFLGFGLRPLLLKTGIYSMWQHSTESAHEKLNKKHTEKRSLEIERKVRDQKYRGGHRKDSRLPKDW
jgi:hypothetical protein